jgi:4,5-dihydroxyphthalate decarboxylase
MRLRYTGAAYTRTLALITGEVQPAGVDLDYEVGTPHQLFLRTFAGQGGDASELSASNLIIQAARGDRRFAVLPVFPSRVFRHDMLYVNTHAGIARPEDLRGKRVGVPFYRQSANIWVRAFLQHDYGVTPESIRWVYAGEEEPLPPALRARLDLIPTLPGASLSDLLECGEIDALISLDRPACFAAGVPHVRRLFPSFTEVEADYYRRTGHFPIMHLVVLQRPLYRRDPSLARRFYDAFVAAKERSYTADRHTGHLVGNFPFQVEYVEQTRALFGDDPFPYGVARNRHTFNALAQYVYEQGFADRALTLDELVVPELLDT